MVQKYGPKMVNTPVKALKKAMELGSCEKYKCGRLKKEE